MFQLAKKQQIYAVFLFIKRKANKQYFQKLSSNEIINTKKKFWNSIKLFVTNKEKILQLH